MPATEHRATMFFGVPTMYHRLAASSRVGELARLRLAVSGSAPLERRAAPRLAESAGTQVLERYGMTETLMTLSNPYDGERRAGTVGFPFPGVEAEVEDDGSLLVRGPTVFSGYWERPAATAESFVDGWFRTGDLGVVEDGYVRLLGRSTELIISGGLQRVPRRGGGRPARAPVGGRGRRHRRRRRRSGVRSSVRGSCPTGCRPRMSGSLLDVCGRASGPLQAPAPCAVRRRVAAECHGEGSPVRVALSR